MEYLFIGIIIGLLFGIITCYKLLEYRFKVKLKEWKIDLEEKIRIDALNRSRASIKGRVAEQLAPILPDFGYNPSDARFIGNPIDYLIFDGYTDVKDNKNNRPINIVLMDVKKGEKARLTKIEKKIKKAVEAKRIKWNTYRQK